MVVFAAATLTPAVLLLIGAVWGGLFPVAGLLSMTVLVALGDAAFKSARSNAPEGAEFPAAVPLSLCLAACHFALLGLTVWSLGTDRLSVANELILFAGVGLFLGQISNSNAHELIHAPVRSVARVGRAVYSSVLFGHHASAHLKVHHRHVGTKDDPNTARSGESFWRYVPRAWRGSFMSGLRAESDLRAKQSNLVGLHPYFFYGAGSLLAGVVATALAGLPGLLWLLALSGFSQSQLLLSDYVQHYGLRRALDDDGRAEPVRDIHSWNAPHQASSAMLLNAPRHSDHHAHPGRGFAALRYETNQPTLPYSLPVMACIALIPSLWRRVMDPRVNALFPKM